MLVSSTHLRGLMSVRNGILRVLTICFVCAGIRPLSVDQELIDAQLRVELDAVPGPSQSQPLQGFSCAAAGAAPSWGPHPPPPPPPPPPPTAPGRRGAERPTGAPLMGQPASGPAAPVSNGWGRTAQASAGGGGGHNVDRPELDTGNADPWPAGAVSASRISDLEPAVQPVHPPRDAPAPSRHASGPWQFREGGAMPPWYDTGALPATAAGTGKLGMSCPRIAPTAGNIVGWAPPPPPPLEYSMERRGARRRRARSSSDDSPTIAVTQ